MKKSKYLKLARTMDNKFLIDTLNNPTDYMTPMHKAIIKIVLRERGVINNTMPIYYY